jgi:hypothetical protein
MQEAVRACLLPGSRQQGSVEEMKTLTGGKQENTLTEGRRARYGEKDLTFGSRRASLSTDRECVTELGSDGAKS